MLWRWNEDPLLSSATTSKARVRLSSVQSARVRLRNCSRTQTQSPSVRSASFAAQPLRQQQMVSRHTTIWKKLRTDKRIFEDTHCVLRRRTRFGSLDLSVYPVACPSGHGSSSNSGRPADALPRGQQRRRESCVPSSPDRSCSRYHTSACIPVPREQPLKPRTRPETSAVPLCRQFNQPPKQLSAAI